MIVYVWGNLTSDNFTPRPDKDIVGRPGQQPGLSSSTAIRPGMKAQAVDLDLLRLPLRAFPDDVSQGGAAGHVAIAPADDNGEVDLTLLREWASFRKSGRIHPLTQQLLDAIVQTNVRGDT